MVRILSNWGDSDWLTSAANNNLDAIATIQFRRANNKGYNYFENYKVDEAENLNGTPSKLSIHKKMGLVVLHMLNLFDIIMEAHQKAGHMMVKRMKQMLVEKTYYSMTEELVQIYCNQCFICMQKTPIVPALKGTAKDSDCASTQGCKEANHLIQDLR